MNQRTVQQPPHRSVSDGSVRLTVTNENWRGKNDPTERRRIQNRLNQRAFRQRQKEGASPKQYKPRSSFGEASSPQDDEDDVSTPSSSDEEFQPIVHEGRVWDELAHLINRNFLAAATANASRLGLSQTALQAGTSVVTARSSSPAIPAVLQPIQPQSQIPHDPIIDIIPHPRLRYNILRAIASKQLDMVTFGKELRASGALESTQGNSGSKSSAWQRCGLVVWSSPEQLSSWELSEAFWRKWGFLLLQGCEDLVAATNVWRGRRGEYPFPSSISNSR